MLLEHKTDYKFNTIRMVILNYPKYNRGSTVVPLTLEFLFYSQSPSEKQGLPWGGFIDYGKFIFSIDLPFLLYYLRIIMLRLILLLI
jgi:hypothetical protein